VFNINEHHFCYFDFRARACTVVRAELPHTARNSWNAVW